MLGKLNVMVGRRQGKNQSRKSHVDRSNTPRGWLLRLEILDRRDLPSSVVSTGNAYYINDINNESIKLVAVAGVGFVPYHDNQAYYTNSVVQTQVEFTAGIPIYLNATGGTNTLTVDDRQGAGGPGYAITSDQYGDQQLLLGPTVAVANGNRAVAANETITLTSPFANRLLYVGEESTDNNYVQITDNAADGGTLGTLSGCSGWDINGGGNTTELLLDDNANTGAGTYQITNNQVQFQSTFFGSPQVVCTYGSVSSLDLLTSVPQSALGVAEMGGDTVNVLSTAAGTTTTIGGSGEGTIYNIGNGTLDSLPGGVVVKSNIFGQVNVNDSAASSPPTYDIERGSVNRPGFGGLTFNITSNTAVQNLTLNGPAAATYDVGADSAATTINSGTGNNTFNIGNGDISKLLKTVTINAVSGGVNNVVVNDNTSTLNSGYSVTPTSLSRSGLPGLSYNNNIQSVTLDSEVSGNQTINFGAGDLAQAFGSIPFTLNAAGPNNTVILNDQLSSFQGDYIIDASQVARSGVNFNYVGVQNLILKGSNCNTVYDVPSTSAFTTLDIGAGDLGSLTGFTLNGTVQGLELDDHLSTYQGSYTITADSVTRPGFFGMHYGSLNLQQLRLDGANNGNQILVEGTSVPTVVNSNGNSSVIIGNAGNLNPIANNVTVLGAGTDTAVTLDDHAANFHGTYTIAGGSISRPSFAGLTYANVGSVDLMASQGGDLFNVSNPSAATILNASGGSNAIVFDDHLSTGNQTYTVSSTSITHSGFGGLTFNGVQGLTMDGASTGNDTVNIGGGYLDGLGSVIVGNSGTTATGFTNPQAPVNVNVNLGSGTNSLIVDDHLSNSNNPYTINSNSVTRIGFGGLTYGDVQSLSVDGANNGNDYFVNNDSVLTTLNSGGDNSNFFLGSLGTLDTIPLPVTVNGSGANNTVSLDDDAANFQGFYTITGNAVSRTSFAWLAGGHAAQAALLGFNNVQNLDLVGSQPGGNTFDVYGGPAQTTVYGLGNSNTFNIGQNSLDALAGQVNVHGYGTNNSVFVNDQQSSGNHLYALTYGSITRNGTGGLNFDGVQSISLNMANAGTNTLDFGNGNLANLGSGTLSINGSNSVSTIPFQSSAGSLPVTIYGSFSGLVLDDHLGNQNSVYSVMPNWVNGDGLGGLTFSNIQSLAVDPAGGSSVYVIATSVPTTINPGGNDSIHIGVGDLGSVQNPVTVAANNGTDTVVLDDHSSSFAGVYTIAPGNVTRAGFACLTVTNEAVELIGSAQADTYNVASDSNSVDIQAGGSGSTINVGNGGLGSLQSAVTVDGTGSGVDVNVNDQNSNSNNNYTIAATSVAKNGFTVLNYQGLQSLTVNGGSGGGAIYTVSGTSAPTTLNSGGTNNSTFNVGNGNLSNLAAPLTVTSGGTHGGLDVNDTMTTAGQTYTVTSTSVSRPGAAAINYSGPFVRVELDAGNHGNTINVQGTAAIYTLIQPGSAGDVIDVSNSSHALDGIGAVLVQDPYFASTVTVDDSGHTFGDSYDVTNESVSIGRSSTFFFGYTGSLGGGGNGQSGIARLNLVTSSGIGNAINVTSTSVPTAISGAANSSILLGGGDLGTLMAPINISGGSVPDSVLLDDQDATFQGAYTITPSTVSRVGFGGLAFSGVNNLTVVGSNIGDVYNVQGAVANTHLHLGNGILLSSNYGTNNSAVSDGSLVITGTLTDSGGLSVGSGATLEGTGSVIGPVSVAGVLSPGSGGIGQLSTGNLSLSVGSTLALTQTSGSTNQVNVTGTVNLGGATLSLPSNLTANPGQQLVLIENDGSDPVVGTFAGLPEGSTVTAGSHSFTISYVGGDGNDVVLTAMNTTAPAVAAVQVNDGSAQRSEVRSLTVTFSGPVTFAGGNANAAAAFQLTHLTDGNNVALTAAVSNNASGQTVVTLTFSGAETDPISAENGGVPSLADGRYQLTIFSADVTGANGLTLNGSGPNGNYVSPTDTLGGGVGELGLFRLFGDATGNGVVDALDLGQFRSAFNSRVGNSLYLSYLDADNSGSIDAQDLGQFRSRFNASVF